MGKINAICRYLGRFVVIKLTGLAFRDGIQGGLGVLAKPLIPAPANGILETYVARIILARVDCGVCKWADYPDDIPPLPVGGYHEAILCLFETRHYWIGLLRHYYRHTSQERHHRQQVDTPIGCQGSLRRSVRT